MQELQLLKFPDGNHLRIKETVTPKWKEVALSLGFNEARIETIEMGAYYQPGNACLKMFTGWLDGGHDLKPATWDALIQSLKDVKLTETASLLGSTIEIANFMPITSYIYM